MGRPSDVQSSKWNTPEFYFYYFIFLMAVPSMFGVAFQVSKQSHPGYKTYEHLLSPGWIPGRKVDNSDQQYASVRNNFPYMALVVILHPLLRRLYDGFWRTETYTNVPSSLGTSSNGSLTHGLPASAAADVRLEQRIKFDFAFALVFITVLHGTSAFKVLVILWLNYQIATALPRQYVTPATWICNIGILFANELCRGYPYKMLLGGSSLGAFLDSYGGLMSRWEVLFNITILRLISFNMDYLWAVSSRGSSSLEVTIPTFAFYREPADYRQKKQLDPSNLSERDRVSIPAAPSDYSFRNYLAYTLYSPLYLAGPILTFNDYISQCRYRLSSITRERTFLYAIRFLVLLLTMELVLHFIYAVAISKSHPDWNIYSPFQLSMLGYFNLHIIWLKLLIPWRFFRLWSLLDGIDPPENMARCMSDNYSALAFWRGWHRSYNRWIVRYIFIPIGGSREAGPWGKVRSVVNFLAVFTFVALWHDINLRVLMWGWLITLFVLPEILATLAFPAKRWRDRPNTYRVLCGIGGAFNILLMMIANLVGFAIGIDGLKGLVQGIVGSAAGVAFLAGACGALFVGVQVMFEVREEEKRHGIRMKC